jgi:serine/threonine protein kinase
VKRLHVNDGEESRRAKDFRNEVEALKRFSGFTHDHLVTLLMTWTIKGSLKDKYCLLFPWADQDLDAYWRDKPCPRKGNNPDAATIRWVAKQIVGMAGALVTIHCPRNDKHLMPKQKYGRHGDIKPENILWYPSPTDLFGILVIADLGLTTFNSTNSRSNVPGQGIPISPGYRPPECDLEGGVFSRAFDIWTFGCLLLEMVCWALGGQDARDEFEELRSTMYVMACKTEIFFDILFKSHGGHAVRVKAEVNQVNPATACLLWEQIRTNTLEVHCSAPQFSVVYGVFP